MWRRAWRQPSSRCALSLCRDSMDSAFVPGPELLQLHTFQWHKPRHAPGSIATVLHACKHPGHNTLATNTPATNTPPVNTI